MDGWDYVMKRVDQPDYYVTMSGSIDDFCLSSDHKYFFKSSLNFLALSLDASTCQSKV